MKKVAICGATGVVGQEIIKCLYQTKFPISELTLFASKRSAGKTQKTPFGDKQIQEFNEEIVQNYDFVLMSVGSEFSKKYGKTLTEKGAIVIDNSSAWRYDDAIPLVIPEINSSQLVGKNLIANPNCTTAILAMALYPIYKEFGLKKVIVSTYQAVSGAGYAAMQELEVQSQKYLQNQKVENTNFLYPIPFNLIPHIDKFQENKYTKEEMKVVWETRKIFNDNNLNISCTAVRIPTFRAHAEAATLETEKPVNLNKIYEILNKAPGVQVVDTIEKNLYPMPLTATEKFDIEVGRIRANIVFGEYGLDFFVCGDQLLKGAALNAVQIAQACLEIV